MTKGVYVIAPKLKRGKEWRQRDRSPRRIQIVQVEQDHRNNGIVIKAADGRQFYGALPIKKGGVYF